MDNVKLYDNNCQIYPGGYVPLLMKDELQKEIKLSSECESTFPPVCINELPESYIVDLTIPGINREDFSIQVDNNVLSVCILHKDHIQNIKGQIKKPGFNYRLVDHHIDLPDNAGTEFISAEYKAGTLRFHIPKTDQPIRNLHNRIVVY